MAKDTETRRQIMAAAARLFGERSFMRVSIRDIAAEVGVTPASLYYYFDSKEEILDEIIRHYRRVHERFFKELLCVSSLPGYRPAIGDIIFSYNPDEADLMFWSTRIIHMEQFNSDSAAQALVGDTFEQARKSYQAFLKAMADMGLIKNRRNIPMYCDILYRITRSFQLDFLHPNILEVSYGKMESTFQRTIKMILLAEGTADRYRELLR